MKLLNVEQIDLNWLQSATLEDLKNAMRSGGQVLATVNALIQTPEGKKIAYEMMNDDDYVPVSRRQLDPEEAAQAAADEAEAQRQAAEAESQRQADELAAAATPEVTEPPVVEAPQVEEKKKYVIDYQVTDEDTGRPIGRPTHFEAFGTEVEALRQLVDKLKNAHINAARYAERVKSNRFKQSAAALEATESSVAAKNAQAESDRLATEAAKEQDPTKMQEAVKKAAAATRDAEIARRANVEHGRIIANTWMADHKDDFYPCDASMGIMGEYLKTNNLVLSYDNLEKAFQSEKHKLPPVPTERQQASATNVPTSVVAVDNSQPTTAAASAAASASIPLVVAPAAAPATPSQSSVAPPASTTTAQAPTSAAPNQATAARKPAVNGGLQPGQLSARRPSESTTQQTPEQTRSLLLREIGKMNPAIYRKKLATDKSFREKLIAAGIPVVGFRS